MRVVDPSKTRFFTELTQNLKFLTLQQGKNGRMEDLISAWLLLNFLLLSSTDTITVEPSSSNKPESEKEEWPEATNKVAVEVQCPMHIAKIRLFMPDKTVQGNVVISGKNGDFMKIYCKYAGTRSYFEGENWEYPVGSSGPCRNNVGSTDTLIVERTQEGVKLMRDEEIIMSRTWSLTDGNCLEKTGFWSIQNWGTTVISGENVLGTWSYVFGKENIRYLLQTKTRTMLILDIGRE